MSQQAGPPTQALSTPERRPGTIYVSPARPGMSSRDAAELDKAKSFARRHIESLQLRFTLNSYLEDFVQSTEDAFKQHPILDDVDKAGILRPMISSEVKAKLEGDRRLITPTSPEVLYNMLRSRFPCNVAQMELDLSNMHQSADESATDFLDRVRQSHFVNQVRLPEMYSQQLKVITRCTEGFSDRVNADIRMKKTLMRRQGRLHDFPTPWSDLQDLADHSRVGLSREGHLKTDPPQELPTGVVLRISAPLADLMTGTTQVPIGPSLVAAPALGRHPRLVIRPKPHHSRKAAWSQGHLAADLVARTPGYRSCSRC